MPEQDQSLYPKLSELQRESLKIDKDTKKYNDIQIINMFLEII